MQGKIIPRVAFAILSSALAGAAQAQDAKTPYPAMAPVEQYLMDAKAEIALARSAAPPSISDAAQVLVMDKKGYKTAVKGSNGFVCLVERSWVAPSDNPDFWNPKLRGPLCLNAAAARTYLPLTIKKTDLILSGKSKDQMAAAVTAALDSKALPPLEPGAMCYMMSKDGYLGDSAGHWHPHLMFFVNNAKAADWGAELPGSPLFADEDPQDRLTIFMVPVDKWSDGTPGPKMDN
jgi:hypothetical protein